MSAIYSTVVKSHQLDPTSHTLNKRTTFKIPDGAYYTNLRLILGANITTAASTNFGAHGGMFSFIKHIRLMDGGVELDSLRNANRYLNFKEMNNSNSDNFNVNSIISKGQAGFSLQSDGHVARNVGAFKDASYAPMVQAGNAEDNDKKDAYLDLRKCFPLLEALPYLDSDIFKNGLRLEIEYDVNPVVLNDTSLAVNLKKPVLLLDEIMDNGVVSNLKNKLKGTMFSAIEGDLITVADKSARAAALGTGIEEKQAVKERLKSYDNKLVGRLVMMNVFQDRTKYVVDSGVDNGINAFGEFTSQVQFKEKINLAINGEKILSGEGVDTPAKKASFLEDAWGTVNCIPFGIRPAVGDGVNGAINNSRGVVGGEGGTMDFGGVGQAAYFGLDLSTRVNQLQLEYERTIIKDTEANKPYKTRPLASALELHFYAEVQKQIQFNANGGYLISYV